MRLALSLLWLTGLILVAPAGQAAARTDVRLVLASETARAGETITVGVHLRSPPGWHTYWRNSGDSGDSTKIKWTLPTGVNAGDILWPVPEKLNTAGFTTYVYHNEVVLLVPLTLANNLPPGPLELKANISWLECDKVCILGKGSVQATLMVGNETKPSPQSALIETWRKKLPAIKPDLKVLGSWEGTDKDNSRPLVLTAELPASEPDFFPYESDGYSIKGDTERLNAGAGKIRLRKVLEKLQGDWPKAVAGLLVQKSGQALEVNVPIGALQAAATAPANSKSLLWMLCFAFLGGLILNIMPCVLPVIALKILSFVNQSKETPERVRTLGLVYGLGVLVSFALLASMAIAAQKAGGLASWGMLLQNQTFRVVLTVIVTLVALNLFGLFEITLSGRVMGAAGDLSAKEGMAGAFFNGVLATVLATPCTAPFLSVAVAFAFTQPPLITLVVFLTCGLGLAAPFVLLCWQPAWLKILPKPGAWMERFKVAMGFPLLATALWLFWFTAPRYGKSGVLWLGLFLVLLAAAAWVWGEFVQRGSRHRGWALAVSLALIVSGYFGLLESQLHWRSKIGKETAIGSLRESPDGIDWQPWSPEAVAKARAEGRPVLVDFTADNCLNCQVNKKTSLEIKSTRAKLKEINAVALLADFSDEDSRIAAELKHYDRPGVPLVLVYPKDPNAPPIVLPVVLTPKTVLDALNKAGSIEQAKRD